MVISRNSIHRLKSVVRRKCLHLIVGTISLVSIPYAHFEEGWSWLMSAVVYFPYIIASTWQIASAFGEGFGSLDAKVNRGASKILRDDVTAIFPFIVLITFLEASVPDPKFKEAMAQVHPGLLGLILVYTWLGIVRALLARWEKGSGDADAESRVGAGQAHGCASVTCEPALTNGSDGGGAAAAAASQDGGQSGDARTSVAEQVDDKNGRGWLMLATGVAIGVLANGVVVRRFRRN